MITFAAIQDRIGAMRPDLLPREWQLAFQVGARRLATETLALQDFVLFTIPAESIFVSIDDPDGLRAALYIFKAEWQKTDGTWDPMPLMNEWALKDLTRHIYNSTGEMKGYTSDQGKFYPNRPPKVDTQVRALVAFKPIGDFDEVDFAQDFEDALVEGALAHLMRLPGQNRDRAESELSENRFLSMVSGLRATTLIGDVGYVRGSTHPKRLLFAAPMRTNKLRY